MKAYGLPRHDNVENPDLGDICDYGLKSSAGNLEGKGGDIRSSHKSSRNKKQTRRIYKRKARREGNEAAKVLDE